MRNKSAEKELEKKEATMSESYVDVKKKIKESSNMKVVNCSGMQCPGPIMKLKDEMEKLSIGERLKIISTDFGFMSDSKAWAESMGNRVLSANIVNGACEVEFEKLMNNSETPACSTKPCRTLTVVVFSGDLDKAIAAFIIANGAAAMGMKVNLFFTFWGLNILKKCVIEKEIKKSLLEKMFGFMMPKCANKLALSKMNMLGMGTAMMKKVMKDKNVLSLPELIESAKKENINLIACTMSMDVMGIKKEELIDGVTEGGVASYLGKADNSSINLFI